MAIGVLPTVAGERSIRHRLHRPHRVAFHRANPLRSHPHRVANQDRVATLPVADRPRSHPAANQEVATLQVANPAHRVATHRVATLRAATLPAVDLQVAYRAFLLPVNRANPHRARAFPLAPAMALLSRFSLMWT